MEFSKIMETFRMMRQVARDLEHLRLAVGRIEARQISSQKSIGEPDLSNNEFQVFSQWGEDGIISYLVDHLQLPNRTFVEFGVESYRESNTRFLLQHRQWSGLVIDGSPENVQTIKKDPLFWKYNLKAEASFVDCESINEILKRNGLVGNIGLLSIDIDGNDYWVWKAIEQVDPDIVIVEFNGLFGFSKKVTVPYSPHFRRSQAHYSHLYFGASLAALEGLGHERGYSLVGTNSNGCNAFFVRTSLLNGLKALSAKEAFRHPTFRESRNTDGSLSYLSRHESLNLLRDLPLVDLGDGQTKSIGSLQLE